MIFEKQTFENQEVLLDNHEYRNCTFRHCVLVYNGTEELSLISCHFDEVEWAFGGPAARVLSFLHVTYQSSKDGEEFVRAIFRNFKRPIG